MKWSNLIAALFGSSLAVTGVYAADPVPMDPTPTVVLEDEWVVSTTPYFWMTFYDGTMTVGGQTVDLSGTSVFDLLDAGNLSFLPIVNYFEARKGNWGVYLDTTFIGLDFEANNISLGPGPVTAAAGLDFVWVLANTGIIYTVSEWDQDGGTAAFDLMGGVRYTSYDLDLGVTIGPVGGRFSNTLNWWDVTAGARLRGQFDSGWSYTLFSDLAAGGSDFSVQALASVGKDFRVGDLDMAFVAGYRFLYQDWSSGNDAVDLTTHGPYLGLKIKF